VWGGQRQKDMIDITLENFESDLLATSAQVPVLLDIWAPWCGPCKQLSPVLEKLEEEYGGRFVLAKVNADEQQEITGQLSQMFGVRSIPFCVMFTQGQPVDGFVGALPEEKIREFLDKHVPSEDAIESIEETNEAEALIEEGHPDQALHLIQDALMRDPGNDEARFDLIKLLLLRGDLPGAKEAFLPIGGRATGPIPDMRVLAFGLYIGAVQAATTARPIPELEAAIAANKRDFDARFELAQVHWADARPLDAMEALLEIIMRDKAWSDEKARKTYVAILEVLTKPTPKPVAKATAAGPGPGDKPKLEVAGRIDVPSADPVIDQYRRKLSMALF
jgi:putative thioredoxin